MSSRAKFDVSGSLNMTVAGCTSSTASPHEAATENALRDWRQPVSWRPFAGEMLVAPSVLACLLFAGVVATSGTPANADGAKPKSLLRLAQADVGTGPQVSLLQPGYADILKDDASIVVVVQPGRYNPATIELFVDDNSATGGSIPFTSSASSAFHWDTTKYPDGPHKLAVRVTDTQGFIGQAEVQVFVNNGKAHSSAPPSLAWVNAPIGALRGKTLIQLKASGTFGVKFIMVALNPAATPDLKPPLASWFTNVPPYTIALDTTKYPDGLYVLSALGQNALGEEGEARHLQIGIANNTLYPTWIPTPVPDSGNGNVVPTTPKTVPTTPKPVATAAPTPAPTQLAMGFQGNHAPVTNDPPQLSVVSKTAIGAIDGTNHQDMQAVTVQPGSGSAQAVSSGRSTQPRIAEVAANSQALVPRTAPSSPAPTVAVPPATVSPTRGSNTGRTPNPVKNVAPLVVPPASSHSGTSASSGGTPVIANRSTSGVSGGADTGGSTQGAPLVAPPAPLNNIGNNPLLAEGFHAPQPSDPSSLEPRIDTPPTSPQALANGLTDALSQPSPLIAPSAASNNGVAATGESLVPQIATPNATQRSTVVGNHSTPPRSSHPSVSGPQTGHPYVDQPRVQPPQVAELPHDAQPPHTSQPVGNWVQPTGDPGQAEVTTAAPRINSQMARQNPLVTSPDERAETPPQIATPHQRLRVAANGGPAVSPADVPMVPGTLDNGLSAVKTPGGTRIGGAQHAPDEALPTRPFTPKESKPGAATRYGRLPTPSNPQMRSGAAITVAPSPQNVAFPRSYRARKGETLQQIAMHYGLPVDVLASVNQLAPLEPLQSGQVVRLAQPLTVSYMGKPVGGDVNSLLMGSVSVTPFRFLFQKQGGTMIYDPIKKQVHARNANHEVTITIGSDTALVNQETVAMDLAAFLLSGRTMVPVRFFEKALHAQVEWTPATGRLYMAMTP